MIWRLALKPSLFFLLLSALAAQGCGHSRQDGQTEQVWQATDSGGTEHYVVTHAEESKWVVAVIEKKPGKLQNVVSEDRFSDRSRAENHAGKVVRRYSMTPRPSWVLRSRPTATLTEVPGEVLWKADQEWNWDYEVEYANWIRTGFDKSLLKRVGIATDCADVPYAARWIFARIHHLPMANRLAGTAALFSNESMREGWLSLNTSDNWKEDRRFLRALNYVLINTYTHTLAADSYPVEIKPEALLPGAVYLNLYEDSGHTFLVSQINPGKPRETPLEVIWSSVPRDLRELWEGTFWESQQPVDTMGGFLRFRWPRKVSDSSGENWILTSPASMPHYSKEQYTKEFMGEQKSFSEAVQSRITPNYDPVFRLQAGIERIREKITQRQEIVRKGFEICSKSNCSKGTRLYEDWSTPERDKSLSELLVQIDDFVSGFAESRTDVGKAWDAALKEPVLTLGAHVLTLGQLRDIWGEHLYSSEPSDPIDQRWGIR